MKTAISLPDAVFREAERHARRTGKSRSQLYTEAVTEYIARHSPDAVTEAMNAVCDRVDPQETGFVRAASPENLKAHTVVTISQGDIWWANLDEPSGSGPGYRRPVVVVQSDSLNQSRLATVVCVPLTSQLAWADAPGNVLLSSAVTRLPKDSVATISQVTAFDKSSLTERVGKLPAKKLQLILAGIDIVLGR